MKLQENQYSVFILLSNLCLPFTDIYENFTQKDQVQSRQRPAAQKIRYFYSFIFLIEMFIKKKKYIHYESNLNVQLWRRDHIFHIRFV